MNITMKYQSAQLVILSALLSILLILLSAPMTFAETNKPLINYYDTPLQAVLTENAFAEHQELATVSLTQELNHVENPDSVTITLIQSGFLDDSIAGTKEQYQLHRTDKGWVIDAKEITVKCYRGPNTEEYVKQICL